MKTKIKKALASSCYEFAMQPIYNRNGSVHKYESLVRLQIQNKDSISPADFFAEAERNNSFGDILMCSLQNAIIFLKKHEDKKVAINISYKDIEDDKICVDFFAILDKENNSITERLIAEYIESYDICNINKIIEFSKNLKHKDVEISIDDFGIKNSNFYILSIIEINYLKIDGHFIKNIHKEKTHFIVKTIIALCKNLNIKIIAEHIENEDDYSCLMNMGVDFFQGFYLGKPSTLISN